MEVRHVQDLEHALAHQVLGMRAGVKARTRWARRILREHRNEPVGFRSWGHPVRLREWKDIRASVWGYRTCAHCCKLSMPEETVADSGHHSPHATWAEIKASRESE